MSNAEELRLVANYVRWLPWVAWKLDAIAARVARIERRLERPGFAPSCRRARGSPGSARRWL